MPWGQTDSWSNAPGIGVGINGAGRVDTQLPYLKQLNGNNSIALMANGSTVEIFDLVSGVYQPRYLGMTTFDQSTLVHSGRQFTLTDGIGDVFTFCDFTAKLEKQRGQFQELINANGSVTQAVNGDSSGNIIEVLRFAGSNAELWGYSYLNTPSVNAGLLSQVFLYRSSNYGVVSPTWTLVTSVAYTYYNGTQAHGNLGDLMTAQIKNGAGAVTGTYYYRYYTSSEIAAGASGYVHGLEYVFTPDSYQELVDDLGTNVDSLSNAVVSVYADDYFQYDSNSRVKTAVIAGAGSDATSGLGTYTYTYTPSTNTPGTNSWAMKTTETTPDGAQNVVYTNAFGEVMLLIETDTQTSQTWDTFYEYDAQGRCILSASPAAVTGCNDTYADLLHKVSGNYQYLSDSVGLITTYSYFTSTTATATSAGGVNGYAQATAIRQGETGTSISQSAFTYFHVSAAGVTVNPIAAGTVYRNTDGTGAETTTHTYTWFSGTISMQSMTVSAPVVTSSQNGPGTAAMTITYFNTLGQPIWTKDADGYINYTAYDPATGAVVKTIVDVNTANTSQFTNLPAGWSSLTTGTPLNLVTTYQVDNKGRPTKTTDPNSNVTYTVYNDVTETVSVYPGWNPSTNMPTGPTVVTSTNLEYDYTQTLTMSAAPNVTAGAPNGTETPSSIQSLERDYFDDDGQVTEVFKYFNLSGLTYSAGLMGTAGVNYYITYYDYNSDGDRDRVVSPTGTITRTVYDEEDRVISQWIGTDDTTSEPWSPTNPVGMFMIHSYAYANNNPGDSQLVQEIDYPGSGQPNRETDDYYDWRGRLIVEKDGVQTTEATDVNRPITYTNYDNLGEAIEVQTYDGDGVSISISGGMPVAPSSSLLRSQVITSFDNQGHVYQSQTFNVNQSTGAVASTPMTTQTYYDHRGDVVAQVGPSGTWTKDVYDGADRLTFAYTTDGAGGASWANAVSISGDQVLEQSQYIFDNDGNQIEEIDKQRFDTATGTGALGTPTSGVNARVYYIASYFDGASRLIAQVNVGTNGGSAWTRPLTIPTGSATVLVTGYAYNAAGEVAAVTDPMGIITVTLYDALGRTTQTSANYTGTGIAGASSNVATNYTYDGDNNVLSVTALQASATPSQTTQYIYGGSGADSNDLLTAVWYPDPTTGAASSSQAVTYSYDALGDTITSTDQNGTTHTYSFDVLGRMTADAVTTLGSGVDGSVLRIEYGYDALSNQSLITSYNAASGGSIVNQVFDVYNSLGQLTTEYQNTTGAVNTSTSPKVQYAYDAATGRLTTITYPSGYVLTYNYGSTGSINNAISRLDSISDSTGTLESYEYLGMGTVVERDHPQNGVDLTYISPTGATGDAGDKYVGLDRFGNVVDQNWYSTSTFSSVAEITYGYDPDGDVLYSRNMVNSAFSELYAYDSLGQITNFQRGTLNSTNTAIVGTASASQSFTMDALGNFTNVTTNGTAQSQSANAQNEYTAVGSATPTYDKNGNLTSDETGQQYVYNAWNQLVNVENAGGGTIASYSYDGLGRRVTETDGSTTTTLYFSAQGQVLEEAVAGTTVARNVWSPVYVNALVLRDQSSGGGTLNQRLYVAQDANWNVTALIDTSGNVVERYVYSPYGVQTVLSGTWATLSASAYGNRYGFQGGRFDQGLYVFDARDYSPTLGRWLERDPLSYGAGDMNDYRTEGNGPTDITDPSGEAWSWAAAGIGAGIGAAIGAGFSIGGSLISGEQINWTNVGAAAAGGAAAGFIAGGVVGACTGDPSAVIAGGIIIGATAGGAGAFTTSTISQLGNNGTIDGGQLLQDTLVGIALGGLTGGAFASLGVAARSALSTDGGRSFVLSGAMWLNEMGMASPSAQQVARQFSTQQVSALSSSYFTTLFHGTSRYIAMEMVQNQAVDIDRLASHQIGRSYSSGLYTTTQDSTANFYADAMFASGRGGGPATVRMDVPRDTFGSFARNNNIALESAVPRPPTPGQTETFIPMSNLADFNNLPGMTFSIHQ
jgi:RHS repeat-associated protein